MRFYTTDGKIKYGEIRACAERIAAMKQKRARQILKSAGCDYTTLHNALVSLHYGTPWSEVDYKRAKLAQYVLDHEFDGTRIVDHIYRRKGSSAFHWN